MYNRVLRVPIRLSYLIRSPLLQPLSNRALVQLICTELRSTVPLRCANTRGPGPRARRPARLQCGGPVANAIRKRIRSRACFRAMDPRSRDEPSTGRGPGMPDGDLSSVETARPDGVSSATTSRCGMCLAQPSCPVPVVRFRNGFVSDSLAGRHHPPLPAT